MKNSFKFNNLFIQSLPADKELSASPRQVYNASYSFVEPTKVKSPELVCISSEVAALLNLSEQDYKSNEFKQTFVGNQLIDGMQPYAMCYGGHQFGHWAGQLGDGRAINLGEVLDVNGDNQTLQLKGAGLTPYSRTADGLAVLRSSVREFLCSEAMFHLGVPTTRALSLILTGEFVMRDMFYDGHPKLEPGAVVCRVAPSFVRFGNFQIHAARGEHQILKQLVDFTIQTDFPDIMQQTKSPHNQELNPEVYEAWFEQVCLRTAEMVVHWMRVGFVHGVMNTDNLSILGLTIDYGPYGWLEGYDPSWTPNTTDAEGKRYAFGNQPQIAQWNLFQLANAISNLVGRTESLEKSLAGFAEYYTSLSQQMYAEKLGLEKHQGKTDQKLIDDLFEILTLTETDMTIFFRNLANLKQSEYATDDDLIVLVEAAYYEQQPLGSKITSRLNIWFKRYIERLKIQNISDDERRIKMNRINPKFVLRNYLAQIAIEKAENGDFSEVEKLLEILRKPYDEQPEFQSYAAKRPEWARVKAGCSMLSCSS